MSNLSQVEYARLKLKSKYGTLTPQEKATLSAYENQQNGSFESMPSQTMQSADNAPILQCPYCGHATIETQIMSDVTQRKPLTVMAMILTPFIAFCIGAMSQNLATRIIVGIIIFVSLFIPLWAMLRGPYSVTHKYYVCKRCGYAERDTKWKYVNDGGKAFESIIAGVLLAIILAFSVVMVVRNVQLPSFPTDNMPAIENNAGVDGNGGKQVIEDLGDGTILIGGIMK